MGFDLQDLTEYQELKGLFDLIDLLLTLDVHNLLNQTNSFALIAKACFDILAISGSFPDVAQRLEKDYQGKHGINSKLISLISLGSKEEDKVPLPKASTMSFNMHSDHPLLHNQHFVSNILKKQLHLYLHRTNHLENQLKVKILSVLNRLLDNRHQFLLDNSMSWVQKLAIRVSASE